MIGPMMLFVGFLTGFLILETLLWLVARKRKRPYQSITSQITQNARTELSDQWGRLGETTERKLLTVAGAVGYVILRYVVLQYLNFLSGMLALAYILFYWPVDITPQTRGIVLGLSVLTHIVWAMWKATEWFVPENFRDFILFWARGPWQLSGAIGLTLVAMNTMSVTGDTGLIDTGLGYSLHIVSLAISPLIIAGLYLGDEWGQVMNTIWSMVNNDLNPEKRNEEPAESGGPVAVNL